MKITKIRLIGYKRFSLNSINDFTYEPDAQVQLILGTNGSGKSSLLKELTPLPASSNDYLKTGSKVINITHLNKEYVLTSVFSPKQEHSFVMDGVELNLGGTLGTQKELVREHFNLTTEIHELLLSSEGFTTMSPNERRTWFTRLSDTNYTYAISVFNRVKEKYRDMTGSIKTTQSRLINEQAKLLNESDIILINNEIELLKLALNDLINAKNNSTRSTRDLENEFTEIDNVLTSSSVKVNNLINRFNTSIINVNSVESYDDIINQLAEIRTNIKVIESKIEDIAKRHSKESELLKSLSSNSEYSIENIDRDISTLGDKILVMRSKYRILKDDTVVDNTFITGINNITEDILSLSNSISENNDYRYSRYNLNKLTAEIANYNDLIASINKEINDTRVKIAQQEEARDHDKLTCPNCNHQWSKGFDNVYYTTLLDTLERLNKLLSSYETSLVTLNKENALFTEYFSQYNEIMRYIKSWNIFNDLWDKVITDEVLIKAPKMLTTLINDYREDIISALEVKQHLKALNEFKRVKQLTTDSNISSISVIRDNLTEMEKELHSLNVILAKYRDNAKRLNELKELLDGIYYLKDLLVRTSNSRNNITNLLKENYRNDAINSMISEVKVMLSKRENMIASINIQLALVKSLEDTILELKANEISYKKLIDTLSPSTGLIAEGLTGFINTFIKQVNIFVEKIWSYPLVILPIMVTDEGDCDLDYRFIVKINDGDTIPDISKGSGAMREVIDLAFKIISMKYLGLSRYPVYLDEFARTLDHAHRTTAHKTVVDLITQSDFSQVFIVNHYSDLYMSIRNADMTVLHSENIIIPKDCNINQRVKIR